MRHTTYFQMLAAVFAAVMFFSPAGNADDTESAPENATFAFNEDWDSAFEQAEKDNLPVFAYFTNNSCPSCRAMEKNTFSEDEIKNRLGGEWASVKINTSHHDKSGTYKGTTMKYHKLARHFRVRGVPCFIFFDRDGEAVQSVLGYKDGDMLGAILDYMNEEAYKEKISFRDYRKNRTENN